jgi:hypothetical protein
MYDSSMEKGKNTWQRNLTLSYTKRINYPFKNTTNINNLQNVIQPTTRIFDPKNNFSRVVKIDKIFKGVKSDLSIDQEIFQPLNDINEHETYNQIINQTSETFWQKKAITNDSNLVTSKFNYSENLLEKNKESNFKNQVFKQNLGGLTPLIDSNYNNNILKLLEIVLMQTKIIFFKFLGVTYDNENNYNYILPYQVKEIDNRLKSLITDKKIKERYYGTPPNVVNSENIEISLLDNTIKMKLQSSKYNFYGAKSKIKELSYRSNINHLTDISDKMAFLK